MRRFVFIALFVVVGLFPTRSRAQNTITTVAGGQLPNNVASTAAGLEGVYGVARDASGNVYALTDVGVIYKATPSGGLTIYAGNITAGYSGDNGPATAALLGEPFAGAVDANGNLYFSDSANCVIRKVTASTGIITTVVGNGGCDYTGDGGLATSATLDYPQGIALDPSGNLYIVDYYNNVIRRVDASTQIITTYAGTSAQGYSGDGGPATQATLGYPVGVATDASGNVYIADSNNEVIRFVNNDTGIISTIAGTGTPGYAGDDGPATSALLNYPAVVAVDSSGNLYIGDTDNAVVRKVNANNVITTIIGNHAYGFGGDGGPAVSATLTNPFGLAVDAAGDVWVADYWNNRIRMYSATSLNISTVVGNGSVYDGNAATNASLYFPRNPALDSQGNLYIADEGNNRIRLVNGQTGVISTVAGSNIPCAYPTETCGDGGPATSAAFFNPKSVGLDPTESYLLIADTLDNRIRQVDIATGTITTIAGTGNFGYSGDGGPATSAELNSPRGFAYDSAGNLYFPDSSNHRIRMINKTTGIITTVAGSGPGATQPQGCQNGGYSGDGGPATSAQLNCPLGVVVDANDNLYIADILNNVVRRVDAKTQIITTVVGTGNPGYTGDNGPATSATLNQPDRISINNAGNLFISDTGNNVIRRVDAATQIVTTFAGNGTFAFSGDGGPALSASMAEPTGVVVTNSGDLYVGDLYNNRMRKVTLNAAVTFSLSTVPFGNQAINSTSAPQVVTLTDSGDAPLAIAAIDVSSPSGDFALGTNTCGSTLAVGAQCTFAITFSPTSFGALTGTVTISDNAPVPDSSQMIALTGTGAASLTVTLAGAGSGSVSSSPAGITCGATCTADFAQNTSVVLTAAATTGTFAGWSGACTNTSGTCTVVMSQNQNVTATFNAGAAPTVSVNPTSLTFTSQNVGTTSSPMSVTVVNTGTATVNFAGFTVTGTNAGDFSVPLPTSGMMCSATGTLPDGAYCQISVLFTPSAAGTRTATLNIADNATGSPQTVTLTGTGAGASGTVTVTPASLTFTSQNVGTTSGVMTVTVKNTGTTTVTFNSFAISGTNPTEFAVTAAGTGSCTVGALASGASCTIGVTFTPAAAGTRTATLSIADNATGSPQTVGLTGTGAAQAGTISIAPTSLTFVSQTVGTTSSSQTLTVSNTGGVTVNFSSIVTSGDFAGATTAQCPSIAVEGTPCTFQITFKPTAAGTRTGTVTFTDNATGSPQMVMLTGTGANGPATVTVAPSSLTFSSQYVNSTSPAQSVMVTNTGTGPVTFTSFSITGENSGSFALASGTNACNPTGNLASGSSCTISVTFTPTATGEFSATLAIADNATGNPQNVSLTGTGNNSPVTITIPSGGSTTGTATPGGTAYYGLQITGATGVTGTVQLGCMPSSPTITCTVIPSSVVLTGKPVEVAFGIQTYCTGATNAGFVPGAPGGGPAGKIALLLLSLMLGGLAWAMQRNRRVALTFAVLMLVALGTAACGGLAKGPNGA
ncbi:MAG: choice-of-anchor D domain-containing protein, partial [Candidatus Acidiferrales bacterium]